MSQEKIEDELEPFFVENNFGILPIILLAIAILIKLIDQREYQKELNSHNLKPALLQLEIAAQQRNKPGGVPAEIDKVVRSVLKGPNNIHTLDAYVVRAFSEIELYSRLLTRESEPDIDTVQAELREVQELLKKADTAYHNHQDEEAQKLSRQAYDQLISVMCFQQPDLVKVFIKHRGLRNLASSLFALSVVLEVPTLGFTTHTLVKKSSSRKQKNKRR